MWLRFSLVSLIIIDVFGQSATEGQKTCLPEKGKNGDAGSVIHQSNITTDTNNPPPPVYGCYSCARNTTGVEVHVIQTSHTDPQDVTISVIRRGVTGDITDVYFDLVIISDGPSRYSVLLERVTLLNTVYLIKFKDTDTPNVNVIQETKPVGHETKSAIIEVDRAAVIDTEDRQQTAKSIYMDLLEERLGYFTSWQDMPYTLRWSLAVGVADNCEPSSEPLFPPPITTTAASADDASGAQGGGGTSNAPSHIYCSHLMILFVHVILCILLTPIS